MKLEAQLTSQPEKSELNGWIVFALNVIYFLGACALAALAFYLFYAEGEKPLEDRATQAQAELDTNIGHCFATPFGAVGIVTKARAPQFMTLTFSNGVAGEYPVTTIKTAECKE